MHAKEGQAERSGQAERNGEGGGSGVLPDYDTTQHAHPQKKTKRSGQVERSGEGGEWGSPPAAAIQLARTPKRAEPSTAARPNVVEKGS
jgi:hypothetical protein